MQKKKIKSRANQRQIFKIKPGSVFLIFPFVSGSHLACHRVVIDLVSVENVIFINRGLLHQF